MPQLQTATPSERRLVLRKRLRGEVIIKHKFRKCHFFFTIHTVFVRKARIVRWSFALTRVVLALPKIVNAEPFSVLIAPPRPDLPRCHLRAQWLRTHPAQLAPESYFRLRPAVVCNHACAQRPRPLLVSAVPIEEGASEKTSAYKGTPGGWLRIEQ